MDSIFKSFSLGKTAREMYLGPLNKSKGEGSRGGKVIGHTKSGKPIYDSHDHSSHKNFTKQDHKDAADIHHKLSEKTKNKKESKKHYDEGYAHHQSAKGNKHKLHSENAKDWNESPKAGNKTY